MREWVNTAKKTQVFKKKRHFHTHTLTLAPPHALSMDRGHILCAVQVLVCFWAFYTHGSTLLAYCEFQFNSWRLRKVNLCFYSNTQDTHARTRSQTKWHAFFFLFFFALESVICSVTAVEGHISGRHADTYASCFQTFTKFQLGEV